jgi:hypothetical protein
MDHAAGAVTGLWAAGRTGGDEGVGDVGALIMLGTLCGLIALVYGVVLRYDPEAGPPLKAEGGE